MPYCGGGGAIASGLIKYSCVFDLTAEWIAILLINPVVYTVYG